MNSTSSLQAGDLLRVKETTFSGDPWRILLIELANLLGLFLTHARHAKGSHAPSVLFDQMVRRLHFLEKMSGHDGGMIIRRIASASRGSAERPDYFFLFGDQAFRGSEARSNPQLSNALDQAFGCFYEHGIFALYLQLPGASIERIDRLRLALNILARFRSAVENNASITFRYFGRAITVPLIHDAQGRPDPNLTVVAGLNGLSSINMRKLIKQAMDYFELSHVEGAALEPLPTTYNQIFSVRSLRSQLNHPLVEINNLPWMRDDAPVQTAPASGQETAPAAVKECTAAMSKEAIRRDAAFAITPAYLRMYLDSTPADLDEAIQSCFTYDYENADPYSLSGHLGRINLILCALEKGASDLAPFERFLAFLLERFAVLPDALAGCLSIQRRAIKVAFKGGATLVGMAHPRLIDLAALVKERATTKHKIAVTRNLAATQNKVEFVAMADVFASNSDASGAVRVLFEKCFDQALGFDSGAFEKDLDVYASNADDIFEALWCILRHVPQARERLAILETLPLLVNRLQDKKATLSFLLSDLTQAALKVEVSDRNAFFLATQMLSIHLPDERNKIHKTSEDILSLRRNLNQEIIDYAAWRMDTDAFSISAKFNAIREGLLRCGQTFGAAPVDDRPGFHFLLSLEREGLIFISMVGGNTGRMVLRRALEYYSDYKNEIYLNSFFSPFLLDIMSQLRIVLRGLIRVGEPQDIDKLKALEQSSTQLLALDVDPTFVRRVKQTLQWAEKAIKAIQTRLA